VATAAAEASAAATVAEAAGTNSRGLLNTPQPAARHSPETTGVVSKY